MGVLNASSISITLIDPDTLEYADVIEKDKWWKMYEALHAKRRTDDKGTD